MLHTKYQGSRPCGFRHEVFLHLPYRSLSKIFDPREGDVKHLTPGAETFWPKGYNLSKLGRGPLGDATYQISRL